MHSYIIQLDLEPIENSHLVHEEDFYEVPGIDYSCALIGRYRQEAFRHILEWHLPKGLFIGNEDGDELSLIYQGGIAKWKKERYEAVKKELQKFTSKNILDSVVLHGIKEKLFQALGDIKFVIEGWSGFEPIDSTEFMEFISTLQPGQKLHIGQILDYHL